MKNLTHKAVAVAAMAALSVFAAGSAKAATQSFSVVTPLVLTPWGSSGLTLPQFQPTLGTLTGVTLNYSSSAYTEVTVEHGSGAGSVSWAMLGAQSSYNAPSAVGVIANATSPAQTLLWNAGANSPIIFTTPTFTKTSTTVLGAFDWTPYIGPGTVNVSIAANPLIDGFSASGDFIGSSIKTFGGATMEVVYNYAPVPEPSTYAMMLAGLVGVGALAKRRRAVKA